jgi:hypothetical protein
MKTIEQIQQELKQPLPSEALSKHPTKTYLTSIKAIYVTDRFNEVFGVGAWTIKTEVVETSTGGMVVVKVIFEVPALKFYYECYGGNNNGGEGSKNFDLGDAYKGAITDALTKIGSWMGVGGEVYRNEVGKQPQAQKPETPKSKPVLTADKVDKAVEAAKAAKKGIEYIEQYYSVPNELKQVITDKLK